MCREQGYFDLASIQTAIFEYNGKLTILPTSTRRPATPQDFQLSPKQELLFAEIIMDGEIIEKNLKSIGFDINWLSKQLAQQGIRSPKDVSLGVCDRNQNVSFYMKDDMKD